MALNEDQALAVGARDNFMVVAIPGSGKTEVSTRYAERVLEEQQDAIIALLTFTEAAAINLGLRLDRNIGNASIRERALSSTFHSSSIKLWRAAYGRKDIVLGPSLNLMLHRTMKFCNVHMEMDDAVQLVDAMGRELDPLNLDFTKKEKKLFAAYQTLLDKDNKSDFNRICREVVMGMNAGTVPSLQELQSITHLSADEFQDSDPLQFEFLRQHHMRGVTVMVVGDDDQSIYAFRNAKGYENFVNFQSEFNANAYALKICYRCGSRILESADRLIRHNIERVDKTLTSALSEPGTVKVWGGFEKEEQTDRIVEMITADCDGWAVLARTNRELDDIEGALSAFDVEVKRLGGRSFWESHHAIIVLKMLYFHHSLKATKFLPVILSYLGEEEPVIDSVMRAASAGSLVEQLDNVMSYLETSEAKVFLSKLEYSSDSVVASDGKAVAEYLRGFIDLCISSQHKKIAGYVEVAADVVMRTIKRKGSVREGVKWLVDRYLLSSRKANNNEETKPNTVVLSTLHGSKGLEFPKVAIINCQDGKIPAQDKDGLGMAHYEEERRLLYVGMTRAETQLELLFVSKASHFLSECEPDQTRAIMKKLKGSNVRVSAAEDIF
ncbi:UvrD-helicase domain-containing protein [Enterovibrio norvegicus]|uniref:UvrD-helicase domain-containing protein n=1 Tax=Enterovibrio norvegicus TaxID=188144 RepID=UPI00352D4F5B